MGRGLTVSSLDGASPRTPARCARLSGFRPGFAWAALITAGVAIGFLLLPIPNSAVQASGVGQVPPPRDPSGSGRTLATIQGRVTSADTGGPIRLALVTVDPRPRDAETGVMTDDEGRYELQVPAGRYTLSVSKPGYVGLDFGQRRTFERGTVLDLSAGTLVRNVNLVLPRGGALSGTLFDPFGEPATNASVRALRYQFSGGRWTLAPINRFSTFTSDDRGRFRLYGLPPGRVLRGGLVSALRTARPAGCSHLCADVLPRCGRSRFGRARAARTQPGARRSRFQADPRADRQGVRPRPRLQRRAAHRYPLCESHPRGCLELPGQPLVESGRRRRHLHGARRVARYLHGLRQREHA